MEEVIHIRGGIQTQTRGQTLALDETSRGVIPEALEETSRGVTQQEEANPEAKTILQPIRMQPLLQST